MAGDSSMEAIGRALAAIPSGCSILTCRAEAWSTGLLASWIQQASFDPPLISVAIKKGRPVEGLLERSGRFVVNVLGPEPKALLRHFARGFDLSDDAFSGLAVRPTEYGVELEEVVAHLACEVTDKLAAGDHVLYLARVREAARREELDPYVHVRKSGLSY